jgi:hypothetical protein
VAADRAAEEGRQLVTDEFTAAAGEDWREAGKAHPVLLTARRGETPVATTVQKNGAQDRGATGISGVRLALAPEHLGKKGAGTERCRRSR